MDLDQFSIEFVVQFIRPQAWPSSALRLPRIQNHRGYHLEGALENSMEAFRQARQMGGQCCELDVRLSRDQVPVVFHDEDLRRVKNQPEKISELTALELESQAGIPSLETVLRDSTLTAHFNIELKSKIVDDPLPRKVSEVVKRCGASQRIFFSSFNPVSLYLMQNYCPEIPRALLASGERSEDNAWYLRHLLTAPFLKIHMLNLEQNMLTENLIGVLKRKRIPFAAWTVNDESRVHALLKAGATSIITDLKLF